MKNRIPLNRLRRACLVIILAWKNPPLFVFEGAGGFDENEKGGVNRPPAARSAKPLLLGNKQMCLFWSIPEQ